MNPSISRQGRQKIFAVIVVCCVALAIGYTSWVILRADTGADRSRHRCVGRRGRLAVRP